VCNGISEELAKAIINDNMSEILSRAEELIKEY